MNNGKQYRVMTLWADKDGTINGCGIGRPVTLETASRRAGELSITWNGVSACVHSCRKIIVSAQVWTAHVDALAVMGKPLSSISVAHEGGAVAVRP